MFKISVNDIELYTLNEADLKVLAHDIDRDILEEDLKRRLDWVLKHKLGTVFTQLIKEWAPILQARDIQIPEDPYEAANLIFAQEDYKDRHDRLAIELEM